MGTGSFDQEALCATVASDRFEWSLHAIGRLAERGIRQKDVLRVVCEGELIEDYPAARPYPSALLLGRTRDGTPLHVVVAYDAASDWGYVISTYVPDSDHFEGDCMTKPDASDARCPLCGGRKAPGKTTFTAELGFGVVVVRNVGATVCDQCGEEWIGPDVAGRLEEIVKRARKERHQVEVLEMPA